MIIDYRMQNPLISVVIPSFNKVKYIGQTLESIVNQKYSNLEVIIQDGGSTDGTLGIIQECAQKYPKVIKFESRKDKGQLDAINTGLGKATGDILTYINADDVYLSGALSEISKMYISNSSALWFAGRGKVINSNGREIAKIVTCYKNFLLSLNSKIYLLITNYLMQPSVFVTKKAWEKFGPFTGTSDFVTEYDLWLKITSHKMPVVTDKYLSGFRVEPSTITKTMTEKLLSEDEKVVKKYTGNIIILFLHMLHNYGRRFVGGVI